MHNTTYSLKNFREMCVNLVITLFQFQRNTYSGQNLETNFSKIVHRILFNRNSNDGIRVLNSVP